MYNLRYNSFNAEWEFNLNDDIKTIENLKSKIPQPYYRPNQEITFTEFYSNKKETCKIQRIACNLGKNSDKYYYHIYYIVNVHHGHSQYVSETDLLKYLNKEIGVLPVGNFSKAQENENKKILEIGD